MGLEIRYIYSRFFSAVIVACMLLGGVTYAQQSSSTNYSVGEVMIGSGGVLDASSSNFSAKASLGDLVVGSSASANFEIFGGFTTTDQPYLEFYTDGTFVDMSTISEDCTNNGVGQFYVRSYLTSGYVVSQVTQGLTSENGDQLDYATTTAACTPGEEFFGVNVVANTGFGADPVQVPDASFSYGTSAAGYSTANQFRFNEGEIIAQSDRSTGQTNYTVSYVANASPVTPAGLYSMAHVLVATATF